MSAPADSDEAAPQKTSGDHIKELLEIDRDIAKILQIASSAVRDLSGNSASQHANGDSSAETQDAGPTLEAAKQRFEENATAYFTLVQSVSERLHQQAHALEVAGIISPQAQTAEAVPPPAPPAVQGRQGAAPARVEPPMQITNGGLGNLDVGWLNSRRDLVGKQKEAELCAEAEKLLDSLEATRETIAGGENEMEVDSEA